ncbi:MAG TPA: ABC transporter permease, partial [Planctomycetota bacterium]|nr:ABC transporter permease [Planctomycetota bacterium]
LPRRREGAFGAVLQQSLRYGFRSRWTKGIFIASWIPALVFCAIIYVRYSLPGGFGGRDVNAFEFGLPWYRGLFLAEEFWITVPACVVGAGLLAEDRKANALELLFARPLTRLHYLAGKAVALVAFLFVVTGLPSIVVWLFDVLVAPGWSRLQETWDWPLRFALFGLVLSAATSLLTLALSSVAKRGLYAAAYFAILYFLSVPVGQTLGWITESRSLRAIGYLTTLNSVGSEILGLFPGAHEPPFASALAVLLGAALASAAVVWTRTRPTEVVR